MAAGIGGSSFFTSKSFVTTIKDLWTDLIKYSSVQIKQIVPLEYLMALKSFTQSLYDLRPPSHKKSDIRSIEIESAQLIFCFMTKILSFISLFFNWQFFAGCSQVLQTVNLKITTNDPSLRNVLMLLKRHLQLVRQRHKITPSLSTSSVEIWGGKTHVLFLKDGSTIKISTECNTRRLYNWHWRYTDFSHC